MICCLTYRKTLNCIVILCLLLNTIKDIIKRTVYQNLIYCIKNNELYCDLMPITRYNEMGKKSIDFKFIISQHNKLYPDLMLITQYDLIRQIKSWYFRGRKCSRASQSSKTRACTTKSIHSAAPKHIKRKPMRRRFSWKDLISVNIIATSIGGAFQGIDGVKRKLRTKNSTQHEVTTKTLESDPDPNKYLSVNPLAQDGQSRSNNK